MAYMGDEKFWDTLFEKRGDKQFQPEAALVKHIDLFQKGSVLDLACGDGRNTLYLLENGFDVTGIDFSQSGLDRLRQFGAIYGERLTLQQTDLSEDNCLKTLGKFNNILICHYRVTKQNLRTLSAHLSENGILFITGFGEGHVCDERIKAEDLIHQSDIDVLLETFDMIHEERVKDDRGYFVTGVFGKR